MSDNNTSKVIKSYNKFKITIGEFNEYLETHGLKMDIKISIIHDPDQTTDMEIIEEILQELQEGIEEECLTIEKVKPQKKQEQDDENFKYYTKDDVKYFKCEACDKEMKMVSFKRHTKSKMHLKKIE